MRLAYILEKPKKKTDKCIVLAHGHTGNKNEDHNIFVKLSKELVREGFAVLRFDFTGEGDSPGKKPKISLSCLRSQVKDLRQMLDSAASRYNKIGLLGLSFGAMTAMHTPHPSVKALVLWSGFSHPYSLYPLNFPLDWWAGRKITAPVLLVTGDSDKLVPPFSQKMMFWTFPKPKKRVIVKGGDHTFKGKDYDAITPSLEWFKQYL